MRVTWIDQVSAAFAMELYNRYPEADACDFDKKREGVVIGTTKSFWGTTYLVVACNDDIVREVTISKVEIINDPS